MTAKKVVKKYVLIDGYGDAVQIGERADIEDFIQDLASWSEVHAEDYKLFELGAAVALSMEEKLEVFIG